MLIFADRNNTTIRVGEGGWNGLTVGTIIPVDPANAQYAAVIASGALIQPFQHNFLAMRQRRIAAMEAYEEGRMLHGFPFEAKRYHLSDAHERDISRSHQFALGADAGKPGYTWPSPAPQFAATDGTFYTAATPGAMLAFALAAFNYGMAVSQAAKAHKDAIMALADDPTLIDNYDFTTGWPA